MKKFRFLGLVFLSGLMTLSTVGCGGEKKVDVERIILTPVTAEVVAGRSITLQITVEPSNATNKEVTWASSKDSIALVAGNAEGALVTGVKEGDCKITVASKSNPDKTASCDITVLPISSEWAISSISRNKLLLDFEDNKAEKENKEEEFFDRNKNLVVGTDNSFNFRPSLDIYDEDDNKVDDTLWPYDYVVEIFKKEGENFVKASDTYYEVTNPKDASIQFKTTAEGSTFKVAITPGKEGGVKYKDSAKFCQEAIVDVVNGYNVVDAQDLSIFDTRGRGAEGDEYPTESEADYGNADGTFDTKWYEFKEEQGIEEITADNFIFLNNVAVTPKDIPSTFIYETNQEVAAIGSMKDPMFIYRRESQNDTKIYGNYFTLDYSGLPLVVRACGHKSTDTENRLDSHSTLFRLGKGGLTIDDLNIIGNGKRAVKEEDKKYSGSLMLVKTHRQASFVRMNNCLCRKAYMTILVQEPDEGYAFTSNIDKCKLYENYNSILYNFGSDITCSNSIMKNAGGPVVIADHIQYEDAGTDPVKLNAQTGQYEISGAPANTKFINCEVESRVIGQEAWFDMMGATSVTPMIKALSDLIASSGVKPGETGYVSKSYITDTDGNPIISQYYSGVTVMSLVAIGKSNSILGVGDLPCKGIPFFTLQDSTSNFSLDYGLTNTVEIPGVGVYPFFEFFRGVRNSGAPIFVTSGGYAVAIPSNPEDLTSSTWNLYDLIEYALYSTYGIGTPTQLNAASPFFANADGYIDLIYQGLSVLMRLFDINIAM